MLDTTIYTGLPGCVSQQFQELEKVNITANNSKQVVVELFNLTTESVLNNGDTQAAASIINKLATNNVLQPKNTQEAKDVGQVSKKYYWSVVHTHVLYMIYLIIINPSTN